MEKYIYDKTNGWWYELVEDYCLFWQSFRKS